MFPSNVTITPPSPWSRNSSEDIKKTEESDLMHNNAQINFTKAFMQELGGEVIPCFLFS